MLLDAVHGDRRHGSTLRPPSWPSLAPPLPLFFPVPSDMHSVARGALTKLAGELSPPFMAEPPRCHCSGRPPSSLPPRIHFWPLNSNPTALIGRYLFGGHFSKETLYFSKS